MEGGKVYRPRHEPAETPCRVYWGSHGCRLERGHEGPHLCDCSPPGEGCVDVGAPPYFGSGTQFFGEDVEGWVGPGVGDFWASDHGIEA